MERPARARRLQQLNDAKKKCRSVGDRTAFLLLPSRAFTPRQRD